MKPGPNMNLVTSARWRPQSTKTPFAPRPSWTLSPRDRRKFQTSNRPLRSSFCRTPDRHCVLRLIKPVPYDGTYVLSATLVIFFTNFAESLNETVLLVNYPVGSPHPAVTFNPPPRGAPRRCNPLGYDQPSYGTGTRRERLGDDRLPPLKTNRITSR